MKKIILAFSLCLFTIYGCEKESSVKVNESAPAFLSDSNLKIVTLQNGVVLIFTKNVAARTASCSTPTNLSNLLYNGLVWFNWTAFGYSTLYIDGVTNVCWQGWSLTGVGLPLSQFCGNHTWYVVNTYPPSEDQCFSEVSKIAYECPLPVGHGNNGHHGH